MQYGTRATNNFNGSQNKGNTQYILLTLSIQKTKEIYNNVNNALAFTNHIKTVTKQRKVIVGETWRNTSPSELPKYIPLLETYELLEVMIRLNIELVGITNPDNLIVMITSTTNRIPNMEMACRIMCNGKLPQGQSIPS